MPTPTKTCRPYIAAMMKGPGPAKYGLPSCLGQSTIFCKFNQIHIFQKLELFLLVSFSMFWIKTFQDSRSMIWARWSPLLSLLEDVCPVRGLTAARDPPIWSLLGWPGMEGTVPPPTVCMAGPAWDNPSLRLDQVTTSDYQTYSIIRTPYPTDNPTYSESRVLPLSNKYTDYFEQLHGSLVLWIHRYYSDIQNVIKYCVNKHLHVGGWLLWLVF